ncbi:hypothetical protein HY989_01160 [Candidatus Micrarchaeota archaeon]|nr:hypothetical protein [Candidatus Micrarchaeota archaeon]
MELAKVQRQARFEEIKQLNLPGVRSRAILSVFQHRIEMQGRRPNPLEERLRQNLEIQKSAKPPIRSENQRRLLNSVAPFIESRRPLFGLGSLQTTQNQQLSAGELLRLAERNRRAKQFRR